VETLDASSRDLAHPGLRRAAACPWFLRALVADNLDLGRPDEVQLTFGRQIRSNTDSPFSTRIVTRGVDVIVNVFYKHSRIKEYLKEGRALRIETVCNSPTDLGCKRRLHNLPELQAKARAANRRLLTIQRAGQGCAVSTALFERVALPSLEEGQRTGALRFGDPRTMALVGALCAHYGEFVQRERHCGINCEDMDEVLKRPRSDPGINRLRALPTICRRVGWAPQTTTGRRS
jgi:hypothetical protein